MSVGTVPVRPNVRLAFGSFLGRAFLFVGFFFELAVWIHLRKLNVPLGKRFAALLLWSPMTLCSAFFLAAMITIGVDLTIRSMLRSFVSRWLNPKVDADASGFHLDVREALLNQTPARLKTGRLWPAGNLIRTDRRICFLPSSWSQEPWVLPLAEVESVDAVPPPRMFLGYVKGIPDRIRIKTKRDGEFLFVVADPESVRSEFCPVKGGLVSWIG